ncbi:MAG: M28 family peptidase [Bacillus sp. (in: firmicutes)]
MKKKALAASILAAGLVVSSLGSPAAAAVKQKAPDYTQIQKNFDNKILQKLDVERIYNNIAYLSQAPREGGTENEYNAVQYIKEQFESLGYKTEVQEFTFFGYTPPSEMSLTVEGFDTELEPRSFSYGPNGDLTGPLVDAGLGTVEELAGTDLTGKIALIKRGGITFGEKVLNAAERGAIGVIIYNNAAGALNGTLGGHSDDYVPVIGLSQTEGEALAAAIADGSAGTANLLVAGAASGERISHNVIATKKPTNKKKATNEVIGVGSHHDSVTVSPGANDNASGTAVTLELARVFKNIPTDTEIRFMTWGAEEFGLLGSEYYVQSLPEKEVEKYTAYFNMDMVGSRDAGDLVINSVDGNPNLVTQLAQASSLRLNGLATPIEPGGSSDHVSFFERGIQSASFIHRPLEPWYHTPEDTIDKISKEKLYDVASIVGTAVNDYTGLAEKGKKDKKKDKKPKGKSKAPKHHSKKDVR